MELLNKIKADDPEDLAFTDDETIMLHQMLNEICNGIMIPDFTNEIGIPIEDARKLFESTSF